jgi:putative hemolysin
MGSLTFEISFIAVLILANGFFSLAEMAVVSARKARLQQRADEGSRGARTALDLVESPNDFLSTVQIGITMIGTMAGAFGGATIAERLTAYLKLQTAVLPAFVIEHSDSISITIVVLVIGYLSLILGELVPKAIALSNAELIASGVAPLMKALAKAGSPLVRSLTLSTEIVLRVLPIRKSTEAPVTEEEINVLVAQGTEHGAFEAAERDMVSGVFRLADRKVVELMRPRLKVQWLDANEPWHVQAREIDASHHTRLLVGDGEMDKLIGVVHVKDILLALRDSHEVDLRAIAKRPLVVPEQTPALNMLERFQTTGQQLAVVVDEHATIQGIITPADLMEAVMGEMREADEEARPSAVRREDGSWIADGAMVYSDVLLKLGVRELPGVKEDSFTTLGGLVLSQLHRIPTEGDHFCVGGYRFEVVDMDGNRIDKVLIEQQPAPSL